LFPKLIISDRAFEVIQAGVNGGAILITGSLDEVVDSLSSLKRAMLENVIMVWDINPEIMGRDIESRLLKILENLLVNVIFVSSGDGFSEIFLSRFAEVKKEMSLFRVHCSSELSFRAMLREGFICERKNEVEKDRMPEVIRDAAEFFLLYNIYSSSYVPKKSKVLDVWLRSEEKK
jgi:hypothetical protein